MRGLVQDLRYAVRALRKSPGFSFAAVATLALGIGANAAIFALVDRVLLRPLPVRHPEEIVLLRSPGPRQGHTWSDDDDTSSFSYPAYRHLRADASVFAGLLGEFPFTANVAARGDTERAAGELVSGSYFDVLGIPPALGRVLTAEDDRAPGAHPVAVLSHGYWTRRFGADPTILNQAIVVNGQPLTIVGVAPWRFSGIQAGRQADLFVPLMMKAQMTPFWNGLDDPKDYWLQIVGRLKPGLTQAAAEREIEPVYRSHLQEVLPRITDWDEVRRREYLNRKILLSPGSHGRAVLQHGVGTPLVSLMAMVGLVLIIACSNLAGLLAARGLARQREYGIRLAIGASRWQLLRQSIVECLLFSFAGGALGLAVASWALHGLLSAFPPEADMRQLAVEIDPRILTFVAAVSLLAGLLFGVGPAYRATRLDPASTLRAQGRGATASREALRLRGGLVTAQIALTLVLLVGAGLFGRSLGNLAGVELGLRPQNVLGFSISPELNGYTAERTAALARALTERISALPGVQSVSAAEIGTFTGSDAGSNVTVEGAPTSEHQRVLRNRIGPEYFATLGIPRREGRDISWQDDADAPKVAVINQTMAKRFFGGRSPLGARFAVGGGADVHPDIEIVGVVANSKSVNVTEREGPFVYLPYLQDRHLGGLTFYVRAANDPALLASAIRSEVRRLDRELPVEDVKTLETQLGESLLTQRLTVLLSAAFGALAALLAAVGIYGVLSFSVAERRQEIGVRIALGADPAAVRRLVLGEVGRFLAIGAAIGLPAAYLLARTIESILFGVKAADPIVFAGGALLMGAVTLFSGYLPARRASRLDALEALRSE